MEFNFDGEQQAKLDFAFSQAPVVAQSTPSSSGLLVSPQRNDVSPRSTFSKPLSSLEFLQNPPTSREKYAAQAPMPPDISHDPTILSSPSFPHNRGQSQRQETSAHAFNKSRLVASASGGFGAILASSHLPRINVANTSSFSNPTVSKGSLQGGSMIHERLIRMKKLQTDQSRPVQSSIETRNFSSGSHTHAPSLSQPRNDSAALSLGAIARSHMSEPQEQTSYIGYPLQLHDPSVPPSILSQSPSASVTRSRSGSIDLNDGALPAVLAEALQSVETWKSDNQSMARFFHLWKMVSDISRLIEINHRSA